MYKIIRPILFRINPEIVHDSVIILGNFIGMTPFKKLFGKVYIYSHPSLKTKVGGIKFDNPVGLSAGFDKNAQLVNFIPEIGFGFEEIGSVTSEASKGNPKPRLLRLPSDKGLVVNYGLCNDGAKVISERLKGKFGIPIGVSVARTNKPMTERESIEDYVSGLKKMKSCGNFIVINVSCPNISDSQPFCKPNRLSKLLREVDKIKFSKPVFLKMKPDMSRKDIDGVINIVSKYKWIKGFVLTNLTNSRRGVVSDLGEFRNKGGISGKLVSKKSDNLIKYIYGKTSGKYILIGVGGIFTAEDAYRKIRNGASLVQLITGLIYGGPGTVKRINKVLVKLLERDGFSNISEAVGVDAIK